MDDFLNIENDSEVKISFKEFNDLSYYSLACFLINCQLGINKSDDGSITIWTSESKGRELKQLQENKVLFTDSCEFSLYSEAEMIKIKIDSANTELIELIKQNYSNKFFKE